jgi:hypothetical protein
MAQNPPRLCPRCGTPAEPNQRFCSECGTTLNMASNQPTALASGEQQVIPSRGSGTQFATQAEPGVSTPGDAATAPTQLVGASGQTPGVYPNSNTPASGAQFYAQATDASPIPPPPPPDSLVAPLYQAPYRSPAKTPPPQAAPAPGAFTVPDYARAPRRSRVGLVVSLVLLLVLVLGGVVAYALFFNKSNNNKQGGTNPQNTVTTSANTPGSNGTATTGTSSTSTPGSSDTTTTTANGATTEQLNLAFTFAGINLTITSVQYAQSFSDDNSITAGIGGVRITLNENNTTSVNPRYYYPDIARLILADNTAVPPSNEQHFSNPDSQSTQANWLDFPVTSQPADLGQLTLQMGTAQQNQVRIPLKAGADLSKYQPKTATPGTKFQYAGLNWTLKSATESLSIAANQATAGNVYITLTLDIFNPTSNNYNGYYGDIARLSAGTITSAPTSDSMFPSSVSSQASASGTMIFLMPQGNTSYTLMMLAMPSASPPVQAVSVPFTIQ